VDLRASLICFSRCELEAAPLELKELVARFIYGGHCDERTASPEGMTRTPQSALAKSAMTEFGRPACCLREKAVPHHGGPIAEAT
jgi:hypothetical protein